MRFVSSPRKTPVIVYLSLVCIRTPPTTTTTPHVWITNYEHSDLIFCCSWAKEQALFFFHLCGECTAPNTNWHEDQPQHLSGCFFYIYLSSISLQTQHWLNNVQVPLKQRQMEKYSGTELEHTSLHCTPERVKICMSTQPGVSFPAHFIRAGANRHSLPLQSQNECWKYRPNKTKGIS